MEFKGNNKLSENRELIIDESENGLNVKGDYSMTNVKEKITNGNASNNTNTRGNEIMELKLDAVEGTKNARKLVVIRGENGLSWEESYIITSGNERTYEHDGEIYLVCESSPKVFAWWIDELEYYENVDKKAISDLCYRIEKKQVDKCIKLYNEECGEVYAKQVGFYKAGEIESKFFSDFFENCGSKENEQHYEYILIKEYSEKYL